MIEKEFICIKECEGSYWKISQIYKFNEYEINTIKDNLIISDFKDWFLDLQEYRNYIINKILEND